MLLVLSRKKLKSIQFNFVRDINDKLLFLRKFLNILFYLLVVFHLDHYFSIIIDQKKIGICFVKYMFSKQMM